MKDRDCVPFLQWALPRVGLRWDGYRHVRGQVCKRIRRRCALLELTDLTAYRAWIEAHPQEWDVLERLCAVVISRFYRDVAVWHSLRDEVLPHIAEAALAAGEGELRCWSIGRLGRGAVHALAAVEPRAGSEIPASFVTRRGDGHG
jgi:chemotaxis protein methyltransferase CheR